MSKLLFSIGIIFFGLAFGYVLQGLLESGRIRLPVSTQRLRIGIQKIALWFFTPVPIVIAIWIVRVDNLRIAALPILGLSILLAGGLLAWIGARLFGCNRRQIGALYCCGSFSNIGSMGSLVAFVFLGEEGFGLLALYKIFEEFCYFGIGFAIAKYYSSDSFGDESLFSRIRAVFRDPFVRVALCALATGIGLNFSGIPRPAFFETVSAVFIPLGVLLLLISVGLGLRFSKMGYIREALLVSGVKFVAMPALACGAAVLLGMHELYGGLPLKSVLIASSMPVAFIAVVGASIYELDLDLANFCWLTSTCAMIVVLPCIYLIIQYL
ncbi:MAG: hypothetical protein LLG06_18525 [Desulfobacteraceae bacterium]|nr:hypothetical protein [Desulfobacteraceae bacterium]